MVDIRRPVESRPPKCTGTCKFKVWARRPLVGDVHRQVAMRVTSRSLDDLETIRVRVRVRVRAMQS